MDSLAWNIDTVASVIDIAVAPVFLLAGISGLLVVLTNRLGRTIDRSRSLQAALAALKSPEHKRTIQREMSNLMRRMHLVHFAIGTSVLSALLVCLVVVTLFLGSLWQLNVSVIVAILFIVCMIILSLAFCSFLLEVVVATRVVRATLMHTASFSQSENGRNEAENIPS